MIEDNPPPLIPQYALNKLRKLEYAVLWLFTLKAREEFAHLQYSNTDNLMQLSKNDDNLILRSSVIATHSKKIVLDQDLTWEQVFSTYNEMLEAITATGWEPKYM